VASAKIRVDGGPLDVRPPVTPWAQAQAMLGRAWAARRRRLKANRSTPLSALFGLRRDPRARDMARAGEAAAPHALY
jgi:hypothetical protein